jgi:hypothetical protein
MSCSNCLGDPCHRWPTCPLVSIPNSVPIPTEPLTAASQPTVELPSETGDLPRASVPQNERPAFPPPPTIDQVPEKLRLLKRWVVWKATRDESKRWRKPPYSPVDGSGIGAIRKYEGHFVTCAEAIGVVERFGMDGIGLVFMKGDNLRGIDFDDCVQDGIIDPAVVNWLKWFSLTYAEISPSGTGLHILAGGSLASQLTPTPLPEVPGAKVEMYDTDRYFTFSGLRIGEHPLSGDACAVGFQKLLQHLKREDILSGGGPNKSDDSDDQITPDEAYAYLNKCCDELSTMADGRQARATKVCYRLGRILAGFKKQNLTDPRLTFKQIEGCITTALEKTNWPKAEFEVIERQMLTGMEDPKPFKILPSIVVLQPEEIKRPDMPESVLCGKLGEICRTRLADFPIAYSWLSILAAASVLVKPHPTHRCNLYAALVGSVHTGKSQAQERANFLFALNQQSDLVISSKFGSAEGMMENIGDRNGQAVLWFPDELSHVMEKAQIQGASFPFIFNTLFYHDRNDLTVQHRKKISFNARVTVAGGVVEENFGNSFGAATTAGLYDRFLFGLCPSGFNYRYRPIEGEPVIATNQIPDGNMFGSQQDAKTELPRLNAPTIHPDVWNSRDEISQNEKIDNRLLELCIRVALVCAAWDEKPVLRAADLGPAWELARYQQRVRGILQPNPGRNFEAIVAHKIMDFLKEHANGEKWIAWRDVLRSTHVMDFGPSVASRALDALKFAGEIEDASIPSPSGKGRKKWVVRLAND